MGMTGQRKAGNRGDLLPFGRRRYRRRLRTFPQPDEDGVLLFQVQEEELLNVRHFAVDKDYLYILVDEDLLRA
jgi:hypothetical protein